MAEVRWVRVQVPEVLHGRVRQAKARVNATWDQIVREGVELWLASLERNDERAERTTPDAE